METAAILAIVKVALPWVLRKLGGKDKAERVLARLLELIEQANQLIGEAGDTKREYVWQDLEAEFPGYVKKLSATERRTINDLIVSRLDAAKAGEDVTSEPEPEEPPWDPPGEVLEPPVIETLEKMGHGHILVPTMWSVVKVP